MTLAVLIHETRDAIEQIHIDIEPSKNEVFKILSGRATFIGQWPDIDVVIMKPESSGIIKNENILPKPFDNRLLEVVSTAVSKAAIASGVAQLKEIHNQFPC